MGRWNIFLCGLWWNSVLRVVEITLCNSMMEHCMRWGWNSVLGGMENCVRWVE